VAILVTESPPVYGQPSLLLNISLSTSIPILVFCDFQSLIAVYARMFLQTLVEAPLARPLSVTFSGAWGVLSAAWSGRVERTA